MLNDNLKQHRGRFPSKVIMFVRFFFPRKYVQILHILNFVIIQNYQGCFRMLGEDCSL